MFDHDLEKRYEHVYAPEGEVGIHEVLVENHGRCLAVTVVFYDTREEISGGRHWLPQRLVNLSFGSIADEDDLTPDDIVTDVRHVHHGLYQRGVVVADTPAVRGIIEELRHLDQWANKSITAKGCYAAHVMDSLFTLWD
jgi:hypothetical protein